MKLIPLTQGKFAMVDDEDFDELNKHKWYAQKSPHTFYAVRNPWNKKTKRYDMKRMHREIMKTPKGMVVDHINHNGLDNQKINMRNCTIKQNSQNKKSQKNSTSVFSGVHIAKHIRPYGKKEYYYWNAAIKINGKMKRLGSFKSETDAAKAYNEAAAKWYGEFANLNIITAEPVIT